MAPRSAPGSDVRPPMTVMVKIETERSGLNVSASTAWNWNANKDAVKLVA